MMLKRCAAMRVLILIVLAMTMYLYHGINLQMIYYTGLTMILGKIVMLDYDEHLIDDRHLIAAFLWCVGYRFLTGTFLPGLYGLAAAAGISLVIYICALIIRRVMQQESFGAGDYLLILVLGWIYGMIGLFAIFFTSLLIGNVILFGARYFGVKNKEIPFAPILATGIIAYAILPHSFWFSLMKMV